MKSGFIKLWYFIKIIILYNFIDLVLEETTKRPKSIPCIVFDRKEQIMQYLGYRHVTGIKSWSVASKAHF
jgi:hypothetical protein